MLTNQEKAELKKTIQANNQEIFVVSFEEMDAIIRSSQNGSKASVQNAWRKIKDKANFAASYYASAEDIKTLVTLVADLGAVNVRAYVKTYGGKPHIILKGNPRLRTILTGAKYGVQNPKVVTMGLGKAGAINAAKAGGILTVVLLTGYRIADYVLTDEATLSQLVGRLATDIVKVGITTGASIAAATFVAGVTTVAIGPIVAVVLVGIGVSYVLENLDQKYGITDRVVAGLDELGDSAKNYIAEQKRAVQNTLTDAVGSVIDYAIESAERVAINWAQKQLNHYFSMIPSIR